MRRFFNNHSRRPLECRHAGDCVVCVNCGRYGSAGVLATGMGNLGSAYQPFAVCIYLRVSGAARRRSTCKVEATSDGSHGTECHYRNVVLLRASHDSHHTFLACQHDHAVEPDDIHANGSARHQHRLCSQRYRKEVSRRIARRFPKQDAR